MLQTQVDTLTTEVISLTSTLKQIAPAIQSIDCSIQDVASTNKEVLTEILTLCLDMVDGHGIVAIQSKVNTNGEDIATLESKMNTNHSNLLSLIQQTLEKVFENLSSAHSNISKKHGEIINKITGGSTNTKCLHESLMEHIHLAKEELNNTVHMSLRVLAPRPYQIYKMMLHMDPYQCLEVVG
eukprot:4443208-Ditylum_brightwellii.AAC.1